MERRGKYMRQEAYFCTIEELNSLGKENIPHAYEVAVQEKYRFFSFGDAMLIL